MAEQLTLTTPLPSTVVWRIKDITFSLGVTGANGVFSTNSAAAYVATVLVGDNGARAEYVYSGVSAHDDILALNKMNLTANSLQRRTLTKLASFTSIVGTLSGSPD